MFSACVLVAFWRDFGSEEVRFWETKTTPNSSENQPKKYDDFGAKKNDLLGQPGGMRRPLGRI